MSVNTSRKPSASANASRAHSPLGSPINGPTPRTLSPSAAANIYGNSGGVKSYNSGWQMWGNTQTTGRGAGGSDMQTSQTDTNYRSNYPDNWPITRPTGSWDDEVSQHSEFDRSLGRPQGVFGSAKTENLSLGTRNGQHTSNTYEGSTRNDAAPRFPSIPSPNQLFRDTYSDQDTISRSVSGGSDVSQLSLALRGMTVEDDGQGQRPKVSPTASHPPAPPHLPQPHLYGAYPQVEFSQYYLAPTRENYGEYQYGYSQPDRSPLNPTVLPGLYPTMAAPQYSHLSNHLDLHRGHSGYLYDYSGGRAPSQYYYPPQPVLFPPTGASPMMAPQMPVPLTEHKKRNNQPMVYNTMQSPPSPNAQGYGTKLDYQSAMGGLMPRPGAAFGLNPNQMFPYAGQSKRGASSTSDAGAAHRSPVLEEFRGNKARGWELKDILGYVVEFCGDQHGSRFIQQKLETATPEEKQTLFDEIIPTHGLQLVQDVFGNYVIQKLFEFGTSAQKNALLGVMEGHFLSLTTQMYGCRVVQKAIEFSTPEHQTLIIRELEPHVMKCVKDSNGNHVVQRLIEKVSPDRLGFVNTFRGSVFDLSTHPYGCRVLQRAFEHLPEDITRPLMDELHKVSMTLTQDQFGNYVIQYVIEHGKTDDRAQVVSKLHGHMLHLARHKFASNVCEKALVCADAETRRKLIDELMTSTSDIGNPIIAMMRDQYANYVLQRSVIVADADQRASLIGKIKPHLVNMRRFTGAYTKHLTSIERLIEKYPSPQSPDQSKKQSLL